MVIPRWVKLTFIWLCLLLAWSLFFFSLYATLSDAQGVLIFIFTLPIQGLFLSFAIWLAKENSRSLFRGSIGSLFFMMSFVICGAIPPLQFYPKFVIDIGGKAFKSVTGMTPYAWARKK